MSALGGQVGEVQHALRLRQFPIAVKLTQPHPARRVSESALVL
jgi:hypothetical protein